MTERVWVVLRHAKAESESADGRDFSRRLTPEGEVDAKAASAWLTSHLAGRVPRIVSSPAQRALATAQIVQEALGSSLVTDPRIYEATPGGLLDVLNDHAGEGVSILVGHNPGLEQLVALLCEGRSGEFRGMTTAGVAWIDVPNGEVEPGQGSLKAFWWP